MAKKNLRNPKLLFFIIPAVLFVGFLTWLGIRVATMDTSLNVVVDFALPEGNSLDGVATLSYGDSAAAIDGLVVDGASDSDSTKARPTASTAKMISALAVIKQKPFSLGEAGETITLTNDDYNIYAWYYNHNGSNTRVQVGEEISEYDALASMLLASSNNMADSLAIWAFGSLETYKEYAANMLAEYGITDTTIGPDASGYNADTTSTAEDLARIGQLVMKEPVLREIVGTKYRDVPVAGTLTNTNGILGVDGIGGVKTGYIGDASGYCLVSGYDAGGHIVTVAVMGAPTRATSFDDSLAIIRKVQSLAPLTDIVVAEQQIGYYEMWWGEDVPIKASETVSAVNWNTSKKSVKLDMDGETGELSVTIGAWSDVIPVTANEYQKAPSFFDRIKHAFGWSYKAEGEVEESTEASNIDDEAPEETAPEKTPEEILAEENAALKPITAVPSDNYTIQFGYLMLINPNFTVDTYFIDARKSELVSISSLYGIVEGNPYNGDNLLDPEAATHIHEMVEAYKAEYPGHTLETRSCYRARGTTCGRLCAATGASDHHTGLTCDLLDPAYGTSLDTDTYSQHIDWQWLKANSYKYGFIDRFPEAWAGGPMSAPLNVDENGSTGLFETWHYRYVGVGPATEIATGKYNNGEYDSLEHYLKARGLINDLKNGH